MFALRHPRKLALATAAAGSALAAQQLGQRRRPLQGCSAPTLPAALGSLRTFGVSVVEGVVDRSLVSAVRAMPAVESMPTKARSRSERTRVGKEWRLSALGRWHRREEEIDPSDVQTIESVERLFWPLVTAFFEEEEQGMDGVFRSELQIMTAVPGSASQQWHSDNRTRGLSVIVPLVDFTPSNGGTQLLLGSHRQAWPLVAQRGAGVVQAPAGSVVAYDSRTYHRGLGNLTNEGRPALIFCYDRTEPPGVGVFGSLANAYLASFLNVASAAWIACASSMHMQSLNGDDPST
mgnify:CR=1 FL=1